ncbi:hypothetical protein F5Y18DRAFT_92572 [Xylariaceae sp. FL1019]|nr:hypothetical protein F5Y18DRAFT_92572 [Xylariaceae sp. FL1019]
MIMENLEHALKDGLDAIQSYGTLATVPERPNAALLDSEYQGLRAALASWLAPGPEARLMDHTYYTLDHSYTEVNISFGTLKNRDSEVVRCLKDLSSALPFEIFLAVLEKEEQGVCEHDSYWDDHYGKYDSEEEEEEDEDEDEDEFHPLEDVFATCYRIKSLIELSGHEVLRSAPLNYGRMLEPDSLEEADPEEDYEGDVDNSGPQATHWYRVTTVLIVARDSLPRFFEETAKDMTDFRAFNEQSLISYLADLSVRTQPGAFDAMKRMCEKAWKSAWIDPFTLVPRPANFAPDLNSKLLQTSILLKRWDFFADLVGRLDGSCSPDFFTFLKPRIDDSDPDVYSKLLPGCMTAILSSESYYRIFDAVKAMGPIHPFSSDDESIGSFQQWLQDIIIRGIQESRTRLLGCDDGAAFAATIEYIGPDRLVAEFEPYLTQQLLYSPAFAFSFLSRLHTDVEERKIDDRSGRKLYEDLATKLTKEFNIRKFKSPASQDQRAKAARYDFKGVAEASAPGQAMTITAESLLDLVSTLKSIRRDDLATSFLNKIHRNVSRIPTSEYHGLWLPFLRGADPMISNQVTGCASSAENPWATLFTAVLNSYTMDYVKKQPAASKNLSRRPVSCYCFDCRQLNDFLQHPRQQVGLFRLNKRERAHVHQSLDESRVDCTHITERSGRPFTLVVTKTFSHNERQRSEWTARRAYADRQIQSFDQDRLRDLLGDQYEKITRMDHLKAAPAPASRPRSGTALAPSPGNTSQSSTLSGMLRAGSKRRLVDIDYVDLTDES